MVERKINTSKNNKNIINSVIVSLFIFQFGFLQPVCSLVGSQAPVGVFSAALILVALINNQFRIQKYVLNFFLLISIVFFISILISPYNTLEIYLKFMISGISAFIIGGFNFNSNYFWEFTKKMAIVNFIAIFLFPFTSFLDSMNYMRFGYAMLPTILVSFIEIYKRKGFNLFWIGLGIISFIITFIYGSRGTNISIILFFVFFALFNPNIRKRLRIILITLGLFLIIGMLKTDLLLNIFDFITYKLNINSYSLKKFRIMLKDGIGQSSSGRDLIYLQIISLIKERPFLGYGIGSSTSLIDYTSHNLVLQMLLETGIVGMIIWIITAVKLTVKNISIFKNNDMEIFYIIVMLLSISLGRLLISSDIWLRPEFWLVLSMIYSQGNKISQKENEI